MSGGSVRVEGMIAGREDATPSQRRVVTGEGRGGGGEGEEEEGQRAGCNALPSPLHLLIRALMMTLHIACKA